jgi:hypothetical protein
MSETGGTHIEVAPQLGHGAFSACMDAPHHSISNWRPENCVPANHSETLL